MADEQNEAPDSSAVRVALWRALHVRQDPPPHVFEDEIGLRLAAPDEGWQGARTWTRAAPAVPGPPSWPGPVSSTTWSPSRADRGVTQYLVLGAGLDTLASAGRRSPPAYGCRGRPAGHPAWKRGA